MLLKREKEKCNNVISQRICMGFKYTSSEFNTANIYTSEYLQFDPYSLSNLDTYFIPRNYQ